MQTSSPLESVSLRTVGESHKSLGEVCLLISNRDNDSPYKVVRHIRSREWDTLIHFPSGNYELMKKYDKEKKEMRFILILRPNTY